MRCRGVRISAEAARRMAGLGPFGVWDRQGYLEMKMEMEMEVGIGEFDIRLGARDTV